MTTNEKIEKFSNILEGEYRKTYNMQQHGVTPLGTNTIDDIANTFRELFRHELKENYNEQNKDSSND